MRISAIIAACALAGAAVAGIAAPARDWNRVSAPTAGGTWVYGNPAAKAKLVEYLSYTCSHCAHFTVEAWATLKRDYVARGTTSVEVRHAIRDPIDIAAALLARCDGPGRFLDHSAAIFAAQNSVLGKAQQFAAANGERLKGLQSAQVVTEFANGTGLTALMRGRGMSQAKINACLANKQQMGILAGMASEAWGQRKISGTPAFLINGTAVQGSDWGKLKPALDAAVK